MRVPVTGKPWRQQLAIRRSTGSYGGPTFTVRILTPLKGQVCVRKDTDRMMERAAQSRSSNNGIR